MIAGSHGNSIFSFFFFFRNVHIVPASGYTNSHSHLHCRRVSLSPHPLQHLFWVDFLMRAILTSVRGGFFTVFRISLMISDVEHLFKCPLAICRSSLEKRLFSSPDHFFAGYRCFKGIILNAGNPCYTVASHYNRVHKYKCTARL